MRSYFELRNVAPTYYDAYTVPAWLAAEVGKVGKNARILDFGCGFGQLIGALRGLGYECVEGMDQDEAALAFCVSRGYTVHNVAEGSFHDESEGRFDLIVTQHVLEHIPKDAVIGIVEKLRRLLAPCGKLVVALPNAQAFTGCYWAFEDFTHHTLYTSGSAFYILKAAGFDQIRFVDIDCTMGLGTSRRLLKRFFWRVYDAYYRGTCRMLSNATHVSSPNIYSYELKVVAIK